MVNWGYGDLEALRLAFSIYQSELNSQGYEYAPIFALKFDFYKYLSNQARSQPIHQIPK